MKFIWGKECIKNSLKNFLCGTIIGSLSFAAVFSANAASSSNGTQSVMSNINGYTYTAQNTISTGLEGSPSHKYARAYTRLSANASVAGGWMGVKPRLFDSAGEIVSEPSEWYYNTSNSSSISKNAEYMYFSGTPAFYSHGLVKVWNGSGYWTYDTFKTPFLNDYTA